MNQQQHGATSHLLVHVVIKSNNCRVLRSFSVTEDFEPGGQPLHFAQMDNETRTAIENTWREIEDADRANFDPVHSIFSLAKSRKLAGASGWENYVLIFQCTKSKPIPLDPRRPMILCHLSKNFNTEEITMKHQFMITQSCELGALQGTYDWLEGDWRTAAKRELSRINNYDGNITNHPWALKKMYRTILHRNPKEKPILEGISLILEWQGCEPPTIMTMPEGNYRLASPRDSASNLNAEEPAPVLPPYSLAGNR